jgi:glutamate N-acetyltransferase/amino-acid N-acetyltransferase
MAVGQYQWSDVHAVAGIRLATAAAGIKYPDRQDVALIEICEGASVSGVFTRNRFCAEPVTLCREHLTLADARYLIINSGNANACTGDAGMAAAKNCCDEVAALFSVSGNSASGDSVSVDSVSPESVLPFSTGVIGEVLPAEKIINVLPELKNKLDGNHWHSAAEAIMTTDTRAKGCSVKVDVGGCDITVSGIAKGSGMIKPNMGTMLGYVATDAAIDKSLLDELTTEVANKSFNRITIDGDESTNDSFIVMATAKAGLARINSKSDEGFAELREALLHVAESLAYEMVRDGEGATKCVSVDVLGAGNSNEALKVAYAICHSPLVKTALFASDPNWGRIVAAIGYAGIDDLDPKAVRVWLDDVQIVENGGCAASYTEEAGQEIFSKEEFCIRVDLQRGQSREKLWTSDLSHEYVRINAEYRS